MQNVTNCFESDKQKSLWQLWLASSRRVVRISFFKYRLSCFPRKPGPVSSQRINLIFKTEPFRPFPLEGRGAKRQSFFEEFENKKRKEETSCGSELVQRHADLSAFFKYSFWDLFGAYARAVESVVKELRNAEIPFSDGPCLAREK